MARLFFLGLIIGNLLWSAHPLMGKILLKVYTPAEAAWLRYGSAWIVFALGFLAYRFWPRAERVAPPAAARPVSRHEIVILVLVGVLNFCLAPWLQLTGLSASAASDNALIVAMEPLITVGLAWIFLREPLSFRDKVGLLLALAGFTVLSGPAAMGQAVSGSLKLFGNLALLFSLLGESSFSVGSAKLVGTGRRPPWIFGISITIGFACLTALLLATGRLDLATIPARMGAHEFGAMFWLGPVGTTASYLFWIYALERLSVASVAVSLFIQPVFGTFLAAAFLDESIGPMALAGGALILSAVAVSSLQSRAKA